MSDDLTGRLATLGLLAHRTEKAEARIRRRAEDRLSEVGDRLEALRPTVAIHGEEEYLALLKERAQLQRIIAMASTGG